MRTEYKEHPVCGRMLFLENGVLDVGVPLAYGLRIAHLSFAGEKNVFFVQPPDDTRFTTPEGWRIRGGHRLWLAPESERDYFPDNAPIRYAIEGDAVILEQESDPRLGAKKTFVLTCDENRLRVRHLLQNTGNTPMTCALWALTMLKPGGKLTVPLPQRAGGMDPLYRLSFWDYSDPGDPRFHSDRNAIRVVSKRVDGEDRLKFGLGHPAGEIAYRNGNTEFVKHVPLFPDGVYPDGGVSFECFVCNDVTEIEGLSPLKTIRPGETAEYEEILELRRVKEGEKT